MKSNTAAVSKPGLFKRIHENRTAKTSQSKKYTRSKAGNTVYVVILLALGVFSVLPLVYCIAT